MAYQIKSTVKPRLQWSLLLAVLLGLCSISSPHLLSHAHAHHGTPVRSSRSGHGQVRSRGGSGSIEAEHEVGAVTVADPSLIPPIPHHEASAIALLHASPEVLLFESVGLPAASTSRLPQSLPGESYRGRAPPTA